jgi:nicotinic acid mononucleotide adenylyltransferase
VFVPTGQPWQKSGSEVSDAEHRYLMTVVATAAKKCARSQMSSAPCQERISLRTSAPVMKNRSESGRSFSSTDCRARVRSGQPVWYLVPDGVVQYIGKYGLYRPGDDHRWPGFRPC